ncbi:MAG: efflux RND transporter periplasmic adaptor subunit [Bacteroidetes bacterium]|nr:MAG: efflux RND transporter periplasmic adaptor subunit [Bacteroidota bacterium]
MDRVIQQKKWPLKKILTYFGIPVVVVAFLGALLANSGGSRLKVRKERLSIATVSQGMFQEFIPINGAVRARNSVFVTAVEGGQVKEIYLKGGETVKEGDMILRLTNPGLELNYMNLQTQLLEQADQLRNTKITMETSGLVLKDQLAQMVFQLRDLEQQYRRNKPLYEDSVISEMEFQTLENSYLQAKRRRDLLIERIETDSILRVNQLVQVDKSLDLVARNLDAIQRSLANLTVRAPISGQLGTVEAELGQTITQGQRIAQVDDIDGYTVRANIDEHYISRIQPGLKGWFPFAGSQHGLQIFKVYPEVRNGSFEVDMDFQETEPDGIKRGQNLQIRLALSDETEAILIPRGGFYQATGGNYIYVLNEDGSRAYKRDIRITRQSDRQYEVQEGLRPGEQVIISNYESFNNADELILED